MALDTATEVEQLKRVQDSEGVVTAPANEDLQQAIRDRLSNADGIFADAVDPTTDAAGEDLPSNSVKDGCEVAIVADPNNAGPIYFGPQGGVVVPLPAGGATTQRVKDTNSIRVRASQAGDTVYVVGEVA
jgi:hypothetical protein